MNALVMKPPLHPNESMSQSINYYEESGWRAIVLFFIMKYADSIVSEAEIAQSAAQFYWFITGVIVPLTLQSHDYGIRGKSRYVGSIFKDF